ncbi:MAG: hypothetical protein KBC21_03215 [Candidatus Pacebacteria bacterium]|nr:hypothetical protein [Candidatus Paceibacterota bacterium]
MKKTLLLFFIATSSVFSFGFAQSCSGTAAAGEVVCLNSDDCNPGEVCLAKNRCPNTIRICKTPVENPVNTTSNSPLSEQICESDNDCPLTQSCQLKYSNSSQTIKVCKDGLGSQPVQTSSTGSGQNTASNNDLSPLNGTAATSNQTTGSGSSGVSSSGQSPAANLSINSKPLTQFLDMLQTLVKRLVPFLVGLAVLAFFWYLVIFIWKGSENPKERAEGIKGMGWSIVALFVMVSIWGLVGFIGGVTGIKQGGSMNGFTLPGKTAP